MRVGDDLLDQPVTSLVVAICQSVIERASLRIFDLVMKVTFFFMAERLAVSDQKLQFTDIRAINGRIVDLVEDSVTQRKPGVAVRVIGSPDALLVAVGPLRVKTGSAKCGFHVST